MKIVRLILISTTWVLIGLLVFSWHTFAPSAHFDPYYDPGRIMYYVFVIPIAFLGLIIALGYLLRFNFNVKRRRFIIPPLILLIISLITIIEPLFLQARRIFTPIVNWEQGVKPTPKPKPTGQRLEEHYEFLQEKIKEVTHGLQYKDQCSLLYSGEIYAYINPVAIYDNKGNPIGRDENMNQLGQSPVRLELVDQERFNTLYQLEVPEKCRDSRARFVNFTNTGEEIGVIPAIIHILPEQKEQARVTS